MALSHAERAERRAKIAAYAVKHGASKAATHFKVSRQTVMEACRQAGVKPLRSEYGHVPARCLEIVALLQSGLSQAEVARKLGFARQYISQIYLAAVKAGIVFP